MSSFRIFVVAVCVILLSFWGQRAFAADNGLLKLELPDAAAVGMGDAFVGESDDPYAVYYDPAGITQMDTAEVSGGLSWVQPQISFESSRSNDGTSDAKTENFLFPDVFVTTPIVKDKVYVGVGESSNFGGGTSWEANGFSQYATIKDTLADQDYSLVLAYKFNDQWSLGAGPIDDQSHFEHDVAIDQGAVPTGNGNALFKANDNAWGFNIGGMFKLNDQNQFGLDYKSPIHHDYDGALYVSNLSPFAAGALFNDATAFSTEAIQKLTLPQSVTLGYDLKPTQKLTMNFDLEWTDWSQYKQQTTYYPNITNQTQLNEFFDPGNPQPREWHSVWSESFGLQYALTDKLRLRAGYEHHQTPVPENTFDTEFPDSDSNAITTGFGYDITSRLTVDVAYVADFYESRNVVNTVDQTLGANLSGKYSAFANIGTMSLTYKF